MHGGIVMPNSDRRQTGLVCLGETGRRISDAVRRADCGERVLPFVIARGPVADGDQLLISGPQGYRSAFVVPAGEWRRGTAAEYLKRHFGAIQEALAELFARAPGLVVIAGSLADPWAACLIDVAARIRSSIGRGRTPLVGVLTLRTGGPEAAAQRAAAYAALKELQYFQDGRLDVIDADAVARRDRGGRSEARSGLFDRVLLVPDAGMPGAPEVDSEAAIVSIAREICLAAAGGAAILRRPATPARCAPKRADFGTFAVVRLRFPTEQVRAYCTLTAATALAQRLLAGDHPTQEDRLEDDEFLLAQDIGGPGGTARLVEDLVRSAADAGGIVANLLAGPTVGGPATLAQLKDEETELRRRILPQVGEIVRASAERELVQKLGALREWTHYILVNRGISEALAFLKRCENGALAAIDALEQEREEWERRRQEIEERLSACWRECGKYTGLGALLGRGRRDELTAHMRECLDVLAREEACDLARKEAASLFGGLIDYGSSLQDILSTISRKLVAVRKALQEKLAGIEVPPDSSIGADRFAAFFQRFFPGTQALAERLLADHEDLISFLSASPDVEIEEALIREGKVDFASNISALGILDSWESDEIAAGLDRLLDAARAQLTGIPAWASEEVSVCTAGIASGAPAGGSPNGGERAPEPELRNWLTTRGADYVGGGRNDEIICAVVRNGLRPGCFAAAMACRPDYEAAGGETEHVFARYRTLPDLGVSALKPARSKRGKKQ